MELPTTKVGAVVWGGADSVGEGEACDRRRFRIAALPTAAVGGGRGSLGASAGDGLRRPPPTIPMPSFSRMRAVVGCASPRLFCASA